MAAQAAHSWLFSSGHALSVDALHRIDASILAGVAALCPAPEVTVQSESRKAVGDLRGGDVRALFAASMTRAVRSDDDTDKAVYCLLPFSACRIPLATMWPGCDWSGAAALLGGRGRSTVLGSADDVHSFEGIVLMESGRVRLVYIVLAGGGRSPGAVIRRVLEFESLRHLVDAVPGFAYACLGFRAASTPQSIQDNAKTYNASSRPLSDNYVALEDLRAAAGQGDVIDFIVLQCEGAGAEATIVAADTIASAEDIRAAMQQCSVAVRGASIMDAARAR